MTQAQRRLLLIRQLLQETPAYRGMDVPTEPADQQTLLRGLMNLRAPKPIGSDFLQLQDAYLQEEASAKTITDAADLTPCSPASVSGREISQRSAVMPLSMRQTPVSPAATFQITAVSTTPSIPMPGSSCGWPAPKLWSSRDVRSQPVRPRSPPPSTFPAAMCCIQSGQSLTAG